MPHTANTAVQVFEPFSACRTGHPKGTNRIVISARREALNACPKRRRNHAAA